VNFAFIPDISETSSQLIWTAVIANALKLLVNAVTETCVLVVRDFFFRSLAEKKDPTNGERDRRDEQPSSGLAFSNCHTGVGAISEFGLELPHVSSL